VREDDDVQAKRPAAVIRGSLLVLGFAACAERREPPAVTLTSPASGSVVAVRHARPPQRQPVADERLSFEEAWTRGALTSEEDAGGVELTLVQLSAPMKPARFLETCHVPSSMHVTVKVVVFEGTPAGVTVVTSPADAALRECVDDAVRDLRWPKSSKRDAVTTSY
jgi:hypothetical protein